MQVTLKKKKNKKE